ncbi:LysR family transcriptional regulator [Cryobacterium sp. Hh38]|uniref:LysR family transcriptional regulator n=1 Tax=Cryobacterium sp. Hh38 TaxID=1259156 RepID=UPI00106BC2DE|nr:LysR family transcriptional regulator [Cryobacterium sp. Hh38]TFD59623.1 LysR family transcriptional regulator [Cryobacterium sp. Hh38]
MIHLPGENPDIDANALRAVGAVHEFGSITAAAAALGYSQPAVSQQLKRLEKRLGLAVVERVGRGVRLTEAGLVLARHAVTVATALDAAGGEIAELQGLRTGLVRLVAFPSASATLVPSLLARMKQQHAQISITYLEAEPPEAVAAVRENRADLAITFSYPGDRVDPHRQSAQGLRVATLRRDEMMLVLPAGHPLAGAAAPIDLGDLADENWVAGCPRCRGHLLDLCDRRGFAPRISYETDNAAAVFGLVEAGIGVALLPALAIESVGRRAGASIRATSGQDHRTLHAVTAAGAERVPALAAALRALVAISSVV